jgi:putative hemolysin
MTTLLLVLALLALLAVSFLAAGTETGLYSIHPLRVRLRAEAGDRGSRVLARLFNRPVVIVVTVLVLVNLVEMGAGFVGQRLCLELGIESEELVSLLILTPLFFVFGEALPKNVFRLEADRIVPRLAPLLSFLIVVLRPLTILLELILRLPFFRESDERKVDVFTRPGLTDALSGPAAEDALSATQRTLVGNVVGATAGFVRSALVPLAQVARLRAELGVEAASAVARETPARRFLVEDSSGGIIGMVHLYDILLHRDPSVVVRDCLRPLPSVREDASVMAAIEHLRAEESQMALVVDGEGAPLGAVTLRDLLDPIIGGSKRW